MSSWRDISGSLTADLNNVFGEDIIFTPKGSDQKYLLTGIYDAESSDISVGSLDINSYKPTLRIDKAEFIDAPAPKQEDSITIVATGDRFYIAAINDDGYSEYSLELSKTSGDSYAHKRRY